MPPARATSWSGSSSATAPVASSSRSKAASSPAYCRRHARSGSTVVASSPAALTSSHDDGAERLDAALGADGHGLAAAEEDGQAAGAALGQPEAGHAVELGGGVAEGDRDRVAEAVALRRARRVVLGADASRQRAGVDLGRGAVDVGARAARRAPARAARARRR